MAQPRKMSEQRGWAYAMCVTILRPVLLALTRRRWKDNENIPAQGGCVLVGNHISHLDPLTFAHFVNDSGRIPRYLAKSEVFDVPVVGAIIRSAGQIPVHRLSTDATRAFASAVEAIEHGKCVVVYPEGTISRQPDLWPMTGKTGAARIALTTGCPVIPVAQWGAHQILAPYAKRPHLFPRKTIAMTAGGPVDLDDLRGKPLTPQVLHEATDRIMDALTELLEEIRGSQAPTERFDPKKAGVREIGNPYANPDKKQRHRNRNHDR